jgi:hypothetical protein
MTLCRLSNTRFAGFENGPTLPELPKQDVQGGAGSQYFQLRTLP